MNETPGALPGMPPMAPTAPMYAGAVNTGYSAQEINMQRAREYLMKKSWPTGLAESMLETTKTVARRYFIVDDSMSMTIFDGKRVENTSRGPKVKKCCRWTELSQAIAFHAEFADIAKAPTEFRLLNGAQPIILGEKEDDGETLRIMSAIMERGPRGATPLCRHINEVARQIQRIAPELRARHQIVVVTVFTDGEASDGTMSTAMKRLEGLPVWTVVRLCTDEDKIVSYWNDIDNNVELEMDVLDDLFGECEEVMSSNNWLTYGEPLHRFREFGTPRKELDMLDEEKLGPDQMRATLAMLLGGNMSDYPHPGVDIKGLLEKVENELRHQPTVFSPRSKRMTKWVDVKKLSSAYGKGCVIM